MEQLDSAMNSLSEQSRKVNIAMHYTNGDMEKSKLMVAGKYNDLIILKGKFSSSSLYGAFILFFNVAYSNLTDSVFSVSPDYELSGMNNNQDWKIYEKDIIEYKDKKDTGRVNSDFKDKFEKGFTLTFSKELAKFLKKDDTTQVIHLLQKYIQESSGLKRLDLSLDYQAASSLDMELESKTTRKLDKKITDQKKKEKEEAEKASKAPEDAEPEVGKNGIKLIANSTLVLSPIKGKHISKISQGDRVMVTMVDVNNQTIQVAKAFNSYDEENGTIKSVPSRVMRIDYIEGVGYKIYTVIAKGILAHIVEEETNIKVALDPAFVVSSAQTEDDSNSKFNLPVIIGLVAAILISIAVVVFTLF